MHGGHLERVKYFNEDYTKFCSAHIVSAIEFLQQSQNVIL